jgi:hypothetical protein
MRAELRVEEQRVGECGRALLSEVSDLDSDQNEMTQFGIPQATFG